MTLFSSGLIDSSLADYTQAAFVSIALLLYVADA